MVDGPVWQLCSGDGQLHLIRRVRGGIAEALCPERIPVADLREPGDDEDLPRCTPCVAVYGAEITERGGGA